MSRKINTVTYTEEKDNDTLENEYRHLEAPNQINYKTLWGCTVMPIKWMNLIVLLTVHLCAVWYFLKYDHARRWRTTLFTYLFGWLGGLGITAGAHRYWCHRSFKANKWVQIYFVINFATTGMIRISDWVRDHRVHHKYSETDADPHNSNRGFFFSHVGWLCQKKHPEVIKRGKQVDMSDILEDPFITLHDKYFYIWQLFCCFILPCLIPYYLLGEPLYWCCCAQVVRWVFTLNMTWSINSFAHLYGTRPYNKHIQPVENKYTSILCQGEGWHNYHHQFPWDYRAAEGGNKGHNGTRSLIEKFAEYGWVYDLRYPSDELVIKTIYKSGDGSHPVHGNDCEESNVEARNLYYCLAGYFVFSLFTSYCFH